MSPEIPYLQNVKHLENSCISRLLSIVMLNSVLAMSGAGLGTLFLSRLIVKQWSVYRVIGGMLAGELERQ